MILLRKAPTVESLMSTLLRMIIPHVGIARLLVVPVVLLLVPVDDVGSVVMLENVVIAFGKVVALLLEPETILVALPDR